MNKPIAIVCMVLLSLSFSIGICQAASTEPNNLLCAITEVVECSPLGNCQALTAEDVGLPDFLVIDLRENKLREATSVSLRESSFVVNNSVEGMTILSGIDGIRGWSAVLSVNNTRVTASVSDELAGFVVFGSCLPKEK